MLIEYIAWFGGLFIFVPMFICVLISIAARIDKKNKWFDKDYTGDG